MLAGLYDGQGRYGEADALYGRAAKSYETAQAPAPLVGPMDHSRGEIPLDRYVPLYERAIELRVRAFGPDHPNVAQSLRNLAGIHRALGHYAEAEPLFQRMLAIEEKVLGPEHPDVEESRIALADIHQVQGHYAEAEQLYKRTLKTTEARLGPDHPNVAQNLKNLVALYDSQNRYDEADAYYRRALAIHEKELRLERTQMALSDVVRRYAGKDPDEDVELVSEPALEVPDKVQWLGQLDLGSISDNLARSNDAEAVAALYWALADAQKASGPEHPRLAMILEQYATLLDHRGDKWEAVQMKARARGIRATYAKNRPAK